MERMRFENLKNFFVNFKLEYCCWCVPIRVGLLITGYINVIGSAIYLMGTAEGSLSTPVSLVQDQILDDKANTVIPIAVYATELAFGVVLLCGLYQRDIKLLRVYMRFCIGDVIISALVYSMVVASIGILTAAMLITLIVLEIYLIILVRSMIVEFRLAQKKLQVPTIVYSNLKTREEVAYPETVVIHQIETDKKVETIDKTVETKDKRVETKDKKEDTKDKKVDTIEIKEKIKDEKEKKKDKKEEAKAKKEEAKIKKEEAKIKKEEAKTKKKETKDKKEDASEKKNEPKLEIVNESPKDKSDSNEKK